jgi:two-component system, OmpR family, response regulator
MVSSDLAVTAHVFVVGDDPSERQMIADYLSDNQIRVIAIASGREIAEVMSPETIDLLILDVHLPGEDGMQIARRLREESGIPPDNLCYRPAGTRSTCVNLRHLTAG